MKVSGFCTLALLACAACSHRTSAALDEPFHLTLPGKHAAQKTPHVQNPGFSSLRLGMVPQGTYGPYVGTRSEGTVAAWAADVGGKRRWFTVGIPSGAGSASEPKPIADCAAEVDLVAVRPLGGNHGFVLLSSSREFSGERVDVMALGSRGELAGGPASLAQSLQSVVWIDAVPTASGAVAMWAVRRDDRADIMGVEIGSLGAIKDQPAVLVSDVRAWQVTQLGEGAAIAALTAGKNRSDMGPLKVFFVDARAKVDHRSVIVADGTTAETDVDLAKIGDQLVVAWSDRRDGDPRLFGAALDASATVRKPAGPLGPAFGPQSVLRIVPPAEARGPGFLAWENLIERPAGGRAVRVATISTDAVLGDASAIVDMASPDSAPELASTPAGLAALTLAPACRRSTACTDARVVPTFVQLDPAMGVVASEPLRLAAENGEVADLAWGLQCRGGACTTLTIAAASPAPVYLAKLGALSKDWAPAAHRLSDVPPPRVVHVESLERTEPLAEFAATKTGTGSALASLTYLDPSTPFTRTKTPAPDGKFEAPRAILRIRRFQDKAPSQAAVLSYRADSPGGVALAPGDAARGTALVAWVGIDDKLPQVFVTTVGPDGKKVTQKMLTHSKQGVSDVALVSVSDGWVVGFIEEGANASEVHVLKIDTTLRIVAPERRVGAGASQATSVQLLLRGDAVFVVWSDAQGPSTGVADIFAARVAAKDLAPLTPEHALMQTPAHSRSPVLAAFGDGAVVGWVEDSSEGADHASAPLMIGRLDPEATLIGGSANSLAFDGSVEGLSVSCGDQSCDVAATISTADSGSVQAFEWRGGSDVHVTKLVTLKARPKRAFAPLVTNGDVLYADQGVHGDMVIRRMGVEWK